MEALLIFAATEPSFLSTLLATVLSYAWTIFLVGCGLGFVIFVHELGHFLVAKACGVKCEKFYIGFDFFDIPIPFTGWKIPRSLCKVQWGETEYGIGILPLGGYVKMLGQDDDPRNAEAERARALKAGAAAEGLVAGQSVEQATAAALQAQPSADPAAAASATTAPAAAAHPERIEYDPRSYQAKPVWARMAIISAGVIMNIIFGVLMGMGAYLVGVPEIPAKIGAMTAGDPAWTAGVEPGAQFLRFGPTGEDYEHLRFDDIMRTTIFNGYDRALAFKVRNLDGSTAEYEVLPREGTLRGIKRGTLGVKPAVSNEVLLPLPVGAESAPPSDSTLATGDRILAVDGQPVAAADAEGASGQKLLEALLVRASAPIKLTVVRKIPPVKGQPQPEKPRTKTLEITVAPRLRQGLGLIFGVGPINAIRKGSPAEKAGFQVGDVVEMIAGEPLGDPLTLEQRLTPRIGQPIDIRVARGKETLTLTVIPAAPRNAGFTAPSRNAALESVGISLPLTDTVAALEPGSSAEWKKVPLGAKVLGVRLFSSHAKFQEQIAALSGDKKAPGQLKLDPDTMPWRLIHAVIDETTQIAPAGADLQCELLYSHEGQETKLVLSPTPAADHFDEFHGFSLAIERQVHQADNLAEAFALGFREVKERVGEVFAVIQRLATGRLPLKMLGGPIEIMRAAGGQASAGIVPLIMFLVMLSANLAVLNALPIPVLDGGHMVFLAAEGIRGKPVDENLQVKLTIAGAIVLLSLVVFSTTNDLGRLFFPQ